MLKLDFEQEKIKEQERIQNRKVKNKKRILLAMYLTGIAILLIITIVAIIARINKPQVIIDNTAVTFQYVNGRLAEYIKRLGNEYTIRYLGLFGANKWNEEIQDATIEYTKIGNNTALYSKELNRHVITKEDSVFAVLHRFQLIVEANKPTDFGSSEYNLVSEFGQRYVADVKVKENGVEYIYQEYIYENVKIRYYFVDDELRHIKIVDGENERKINVIADKKVKKDLFNMPEDYKRNRS